MQEALISFLPMPQKPAKQTDTIEPAILVLECAYDLANSELGDVTQFAECTDTKTWVRAPACHRLFSTSMIPALWR